MQLFRPEALRGQDRLHGDVVLVSQVSWRLLGVLLAATIAAAAVFLGTARYAEIAHVPGRLAADGGMILAVSPGPGRVEAVLVREGQQVEAGALLARTSAGPLTASEAGTVIEIQAGPGDAASPVRPILSLLPRDSRLIARVEVPRATANSVAPGRSVRIALDAFPPERFGTIDARIHSVSPAAGASPGEAVLVEAVLSPDAVAAFAGGGVLRPGLTVSAQVPVGSRTLAGWLLEPLWPDGRR